MVYPLLPAFVTGTLGGGAVILGLLDGAADLTSAALKVWSGRLADRPGWRKPLILLGYATAILVRPLIAVASAAWQVVGFRVVDRVGKGLRTPPRDALIAGGHAARGAGTRVRLPPRRPTTSARWSGSLAAWYLLTRGAEVRSVIGWSVVPGLLAFVVLAAVLRGAPPAAAPAPRGGAPPADASGRVFWAPVLALTALTLFRLPEALLLLRLQEQGVAVAAVPLVWAGLHVVRSASSYPGGWLSDRLGPRLAVAAGGVVFAMVAAALAAELGVAGAIAVVPDPGLVAGLTEAAERALVARLAPVRTGRGFGVYHALTGAGRAAGRARVRGLYQVLGPRHGAAGERGGHRGGGGGLARRITSNRNDGETAMRTWLGWRSAWRLAHRGGARRPRCRCGWAIPPAPPTPSCTRRSGTAPRAADSVLAVMRERTSGPALAPVARGARRGRRLERCASSRSPAWPSCGPRPTPTAPRRLAPGHRGRPRCTAVPGTQDSIRDLLAAAAGHRPRAPARACGAMPPSWPTSWPRCRPRSTTTATPGCSAAFARARRTRSRPASSPRATPSSRSAISPCSPSSPTRQLIPLLARVYAAPDSFGVPKRYAIRASDGLLWIGTRGEPAGAARRARAAPGRAGVYADPGLARGGSISWATTARR